MKLRIVQSFIILMNKLSKFMHSHTLIFASNFLIFCSLLMFTCLVDFSFDISHVLLSWRVLFSRRLWAIVYDSIFLRIWIRLISYNVRLNDSIFLIIWMRLSYNVVTSMTNLSPYSYLSKNCDFYLINWIYAPSLSKCLDPHQYHFVTWRWGVI